MFHRLALPVSESIQNYAFDLALNTGILNWLRYCAPFRPEKANNIQSILLSCEVHKSLSSAPGGMEKDTGIETPSGRIFNSCIRTFLSAVHRDMVEVLDDRPEECSVNSHTSCT